MASMFISFAIQRSRVLQDMNCWALLYCLVTLLAWLYRSRPPNIDLHHHYVISFKYPPPMLSIAVQRSRVLQ